VVALGDDLRTGELALNQFAADLYEVLMQSGERPLYEDPRQFFALTYPIHNLRELARDVALRLAGKSDKAVRQLELTYGGGKTPHALSAAPQCGICSESRTGVRRSQGASGATNLRRDSFVGCVPRTINTRVCGAWNAPYGTTELSRLKWIPGFE